MNFDDAARAGARPTESRGRAFACDLVLQALRDQGRADDADKLEEALRDPDEWKPRPLSLLIDRLDCGEAASKTAVDNWRDRYLA